MSRLIIIVFIVVAGWYGNHWYKQHEAALAEPARAASKARQAPSTPPSTHLRCDGRTRCSQMTSCAEATFFLQKCPGTKMDGDHNGVPCERQWCTSGSSGDDQRERHGRWRFR